MRAHWLLILFIVFTLIALVKTLCFLFESSRCGARWAQSSRLAPGGAQPQGGVACIRPSAWVSMHQCSVHEHLLSSEDDVRLFAFVRFTTGDAMSKRSKFALITWIGENVSGLQRAKTGTDKTLVKEVVQNFAKEFVISDRKELEEDFIKSELKKAGGANYDAQTE
uniref:Coactosin-like protein n=1 Tax=Suricata suricatta TaxID=37032 RepID=A0A673V7I2_SURSU